MKLCEQFGELVGTFEVYEHREAAMFCEVERNLDLAGEEGDGHGYCGWLVGGISESA